MKLLLHLLTSLHGTSCHFAAARQSRCFRAKADIELHFMGTRPKHFEACFLCRQAFEFGSRAYEGRRIPAWEMMVCTSCYESN